MLALQCDEFGPVENVKLVETAEPEKPGPDELIIEVAYASVSHAVGLMIQGRYQRRPPLPFSPGTEVAGKVVSIGPNITRFQAGDDVVAIVDWGAYAQRIKARQHTVYRVPPGLSLLDALPLPISYGTAYTGLFWRCGLQPGANVLVLGAGAGVGLAAVEIASQAGANVIACASTEEKREAALRRGARDAVAPGSELAEDVKRLTAGQGVDIVVDPVGGDLFSSAVRATTHGGQLLVIGFASGSMPKVQANLLLVKNLTVHGFFYGRYIGWTPTDERMVHAPALQGVMQTMLEWARDGRIHPEVSKVYPITGLSDALAALNDRSVVGKLAISMHS